MTRLRIVAEIPEGKRVSEVERDLAALAAKWGANLERGTNPKLPLSYHMTRRYLPQEMSK